MPTTVTKTIGTTGDYSTVQAWEDALPANLVTADEAHVGELQNQEFTVAGTVVTISGQTTDATRNITLKCVSGASFRDHASVRTNPLLYNASNGAALRSTSNYTNGATATSNYVRFEGLQISGPTSGGLALGGNGTNGVFDSCIFRNPATNSLCVDKGGSTQSFLNCLIVGGHSGFRAAGGGTQIVAGCTIIKTGSAGNTGITINYASAYTIKNTAIFNYSTVSSFNGSTDSGSGYNATDGASAPGSNNQTSLTYANQFENTSNDWRAKSTGDLDAGTPDSTNTPDDITGLTRHATTPWIGCWEISSGGAITGTCSLVFASGSSTLTGAGNLAGTATNVFAAGSSTLTGAGALLGSSAITFGAGSSTLVGAGALVGSSAIVFTNSATPSGGGAILGSSALVFDDGSSVLIGAGALVGTAAITIIPAGSLAVGSISGSAGITITPTGSLVGAGALLGTAALAFTCSILVVSPIDYAQLQWTVPRALLDFTAPRNRLDYTVP